MTEKFKEVGVVEGFYGRVWGVDEREKFIDDLAPFGLNTYLYAPKHEATLGAKLMEPPGAEEQKRLTSLAGHCAGKSVRVYAGLHLEPPFNPENKAHLKALKEKMARLLEMGFSGFAFLFDDLSSAPFEQGGPFGDSLAGAQGHAVTEAIKEYATQSVRVLACPSLYTLDPILEKEYGAFEPDYLGRLHRACPEGVAWLWTGPRVCSGRVSGADLNHWLGGLKREVVLWDNYPVNDAAMVNSLHLGPLSGRSATLPGCVSGYLFNPMLQPALGALSAATCLAYGSDPAGYHPAKAWGRALAALAPKATHQALTDLEALTRRSCLEETLSLSGFPQELEAAWGAKDGKGNGESIREGAEKLAEILEILKSELPAQMYAEASPWLEKLEAARAIMAEVADEGGETDKARKKYKAAKAYVLGPWFNPS